MPTTTKCESPDRRRKRCAQVLLDAGYTCHHVDMGDKRTARMTLALLALFFCVFLYLIYLANLTFGVASAGVADVLAAGFGGWALFFCAVAAAACIQAAGARGRFSSVRVGVASTNCCEDLGRAAYFLSGAAPFFLAGVLPLLLGCAVGSYRLVLAAGAVMVPLAANLCLSCMVLAAPRGSRFLEDDFAGGAVGYSVFVPPAAGAGARDAD